MAGADGHSEGGHDDRADDRLNPSACPGPAALLDQVAEAVAVVGPDGALLYANAPWRRLMDDPQETPAATRERLAALPHFAVRTSPTGGGGSLIQARQDEAHMLREMLDHLGSSLAVYDHTERFRYGNAAFHRRFPNHGEDSELVGRTFEELVRATLAAGIAVDAQALTDPEGYVERRLAEFRDRRPGDSERLSPSGQWDLLRTRYTPSGLRLSLRTEITEQKRTQEELRRAKERLEVEVAARARFVARLSHDLRTPLSAVLGYAELIETEVMGPLGSPKYQEYAALIRQSGRQLLQLVEGLLEVSRTEARRGEMREEPVDLADLLRSEIAGVEPQARANRTQVGLVLPDGFPQLAADPRMLRQMVLSLVSNAIRHTADGIVTVSLHERADGGIDVAVADNGSGMAPEVLARLGEPYFQGHRADGEREAGAGLGIAIVKDLLRLHQGRLEVASTPGVGTKAVLSFPPERTRAAGSAP